MRIQNAKPQDIAACTEFLEGADGRVVSLVFGSTDVAAGMEDARYVLVAWEELPARLGGDRISGLAVGETEEGPDGYEVRLTCAIRDAAAIDGVATRLMSHAFALIASDQDIRRLVVTVPRLNARGRLIADCYGLTEDGIISSRDERKDGAAQWSRAFHREEATDGTALFYLEDVVDAMEEQDDNATAYGDLKTGNLKVDLSNDFGWDLGLDWELGLDEEEEEEEEDELEDDEDTDALWRELPGRYEMNDMGTMRTFARAHGGAVAEDLIDATHGRGPYRRFKERCEDHNLLGEYFAYQRDAHRETAVGWFEDNGLSWTEGARPSR